MTLPFPTIDATGELFAPAMAALIAAIEEERRASLESAYRVGCAIQHLYDRWEQQRQDIDANDGEAAFIEQLADTLLDSDTWLRDQWRLARTFSEEQFQRLCAAPGVNMANIDRLVDVDDERRGQLLERIVARGLRGRRLAAAIAQRASVA